jgi:ribose transport system substrate-binding protein
VRRHGGLRGRQRRQHGAGRASQDRVVANNTTLSFAKEMGQGFRQGATWVGGVDASVDGPPTSDGPRQVEIFKNFAKSAKGGISISASEPELIAPPLAEAGAAGIPLIAVDSRPAAGSGVKLYIGNDNEALGRQLADEAIKRLPANATGKIILGIPSPGAPALERRIEGMRGRFKEKLPKVMVLGPFATSVEPSANASAWKVLVKANPKALAFLGVGDADAISLSTLRAQTKGTWLGAGIGVDNRVLQGIKAGNLFVSVSPEHFVKGALAGWLAANRAKSGKALPEGWVYTPGLVITKANVDEIIKRQSSDANKIEWFKPQVEKITGDLNSYLRPLDG